MLDFDPGLEFDRLYLQTIAKIENARIYRCPTLQIRRRFIELTLKRRCGASSARSHLQLCGQLRSTWRRCYTSATCLMCLAQSPTHTLTCGHRLCDSCVIICGTSSTSYSWDIQVPQCPLCGNQSASIIPLEPYTAGRRVLELGGSIKDKLAIWHFLKDLQCSTGLELYVQDLFDVAIGLSIGEI